MPERLDRLRATLDDLERELQNLDTLDEQTRARLEATRSDIQAALDKQGAADIESESFIERLNDATQEFESSHPTLTVVVSKIIDALGQLGI